jgi:hypothetical protein
MCSGASSVEHNYLKFEYNCLNITVQYINIYNFCELIQPPNHTRPTDYHTSYSPHSAMNNETGYVYLQEGQSE